MRVVLGSLAILVIVLGLVPATEAASVAAQPAVVDTGDELVIITNLGRLEARDPYVPTGFVRVTWTSPDTGFTDVATGDFNGDGSDEVIGLRGGVAEVYDPVPLPGEVPTTRSFMATAGQIWLRVVTGNFDNDSADELVLVETRSVANEPIRMVAYDFTATGWNLIYSEAQGAVYQGLATGDVMGNGKDQVVGVRTRGSSHEMLIFDPANNWRLIHYGTGYGFPWSALAVGNVSDDSANKDEIVTSRSGTGANLPSFYVFRWLAQNTGLQDVASRVFNPQFLRIALGDVNISGEKEVYLLRNNQASYQAALASVNLGSDPALDFDLYHGETRWNGIQTGDVDADNKDEVIIMSPTEYRIFTEPSVTTTFVPETGSFFSNGNFAVGNLDGPGVPSATLSVTPLTINRTVQAGQNATDPITIANTGGGTLNWTATVVDGSSWLSISPVSGTAPSTPELSINTSGLAPAPYTGRVRIDAPGATGSPQTITVNLTVTAAPPTLSVSPLTVDLTLQAGQNATEPISITSTGAGTLNWTATVVDGSSWLSISPASGTAPWTAELRINTSGLAPAPYVGRVRIDAPGATGSPQTITVNLTVTAPQFSVQPDRVSWIYQPPANPGVRPVSISGQNVAWHAGVVPMAAAAQVERAIAAGQAIKFQDGWLVIGEGANTEEVPIVDWIDVNPVTGVATPGGIFVDLSLVLSRVPYGFNSAAVVFVADTMASPQAVVVRASALRTQPNGDDLWFLPLLVRGS